MSFEDFWSIYPRRKAKGTARRAWERALKCTAESVILDGARRYALERVGQDPTFTKHPSTWLNGECWSDEADHREKNSAELADELRNGAKDGSGHSYGEQDLFSGATRFAGPGNNRHH